MIRCILCVQAALNSVPRPSLRVLPAVVGLAVALLIPSRPVAAQPAAANTDESKAGLYTLPDPLVGSDGERVTTAEAWNARRRPEIMRLFETYMFGKVPT